MGPGFSDTSHHGPKPTGGTETTYDNDSATTGAAAEATSTTAHATNEQYHVSVNEHERLEHKKTKLTT